MVVLAGQRGSQLWGWWCLKLSYAQRRLTYEAVDDLKEALKRPPWLLEPIDIWRAYKRLASDKVRGNPAGTLADIVMLVRYALGQSDALEPMSSLTAGRFNLWLGREEKAGRVYSAEQRAWLMAIGDHLSVNVEIRPEDMMDAPEFSGRVGIVRARALFGARLPGLLDDLTDRLVAWYLSMVSINGIYQSSEGGGIMSATAKLFMHGRSQAVRLPKEFRFEGTEVRVSKVGDKVILEPLARTEAQIAAVWAEIDALRNGEDLFPEGGFDDPPAEPDPRKFFD